MMTNGVAVVIAPRFGQILFRNCWNLALPDIEVDTSRLQDEQTVDVNLRAGTITVGQERLATFSPPSQFLMDMVRHGGLLQQIRAQVKQR